MTYSIIKSDGIINFTLDYSNRLGRGATADVYKVTISGTSYAVKIYKDPSRVNWQKLTVMTELGRNEDYEFVLTHSWPVGIVQENGKNIGFAMFLFDLNLFLSLDHYYDHILRKKVTNAGLLTLPNLILIAKNLCIELDKFHKRNIYLIDIKPQNIVVNTTTNEVVLLDCDGFYVEKDGYKFPATLISADYIAPEVTSNKLMPENLGLNQDLYALSVLIFQILNRGLHPFSGKFKGIVEETTNDGKATLGQFAYGVEENPKISPHVSSLHKMWADKILLTFENGFAKGKRASAADWLDIFEEIERKKGFVRCDKFPTDAKHIKFRSKECIQCKVDKLQPLAPTPSSPPPRSPEPRTSPPIIPTAPPKRNSLLNGWLLFVIIVFVTLLFLSNGGNQSVNNSRVKNTFNQSSCTVTTLAACNASQLCSLATYTSLDTKKWVSENSVWVKEAKRRGLSCDVKRVVKPACNVQNISLCSDLRLCQFATVSDGDGKKWISETNLFVKEAKRRGLSCDVKRVCNVQNISFCSDLRLCQFATVSDGDGKKWNSETNLFVKEAKRRGLSCNVDDQGPQKKVCSQEPKNCSTDDLCRYATKYQNGANLWSDSDQFSAHVSEAKRRGLTCGVDATSKIRAYTYLPNKSIIGYDILARGIKGVTFADCLQQCAGRPECKAVSYVVQDRWCWLKPQTGPLTLRAGVNTAIFKD